MQLQQATCTAMWYFKQYYLARMVAGGIEAESRTRCRYCLQGVPGDIPMSRPSA